MVFFWDSSDSKFPQVSWTLLSIRANPDKAVVPIVSTFPVVPIIIIIIIIIIYSFRVFHISVNWWFFLVFEWQQVSSSLQDSSHDSGHS